TTRARLTGSDRALVRAEGPRREPGADEREGGQEAHPSEHEAPVDIRAHGFAPRFDGPVDRIEAGDCLDPAGREVRLDERGREEAERQRDEGDRPDQRLPLPDDERQSVRERAERGPEQYSAEDEYEDAAHAARKARADREPEEDDDHGLDDGRDS